MSKLPPLPGEVAQIAAELRKAPEVALFSHVSPDGDCVGSSLALARALANMGKVVTVYNRDPVAYPLQFLSGIETFKAAPPPKLPEIVVFLDCADLERCGFPPELFEKSKIINIDHHVSNNRFGELNWVDTAAAATGEMVYALIQELGTEIDSEIATYLYTAIVTDTGLFQYSNTTPMTHRIAADLMERGIDILTLHHYLFNQKPLAQVQLLKHALQSLELHYEGLVAVITLTRKDFQQCRALDSHSDGLINHARTIEGVEGAVLLREIEPEGIRVALRSNLWLDVNQIAAKFGGGGHQRAAGCTLMTPLPEAKRQILAAFGEVIQNGRNH